jgi:hypothetical protein
MSAPNGHDAYAEDDYINLLPWGLHAESWQPTRYRALMPGTGYWAVAVGWEWKQPESPLTLWWEPVVCFAIQRGRVEDGEPASDIVVPLVRADGTLLPPQEVFDCDNQYFANLYTDAERHDPATATGILEEGEERRAEILAAKAEHDRTHQDMMTFVKAPPNPAAFASQMRQCAKSRDHAWLAIMLADGHGPRPPENIQQREEVLYRRWRQKQRVKP